MLLIALKHEPVLLTPLYMDARIAHAINSVETDLNRALVWIELRVLRMLLIALKRATNSSAFCMYSAYCACY